MKIPNSKSMFMQKHPNFARKWAKGNTQQQLHPIDPGMRRPVSPSLLGGRSGGAYKFGGKKPSFKGGLYSQKKAPAVGGGGGGGAPAPKKRGHKKLPPFDLNAPLDRKSYQREIRATADLQFNDKQRELEGQARASQMQEGRIGDWFTQYQQQLAAIRGQTQGNYANVNSQMQGNLQNAANRDQTMRAGAAQDEAQQAAVRGVPLTPGPDTSAAAANIRQSLGTSYSNMVGSQGAANYSYLADKESIGGREKIQQLLAEAARGRNIHSSLAQLMGDKGLARVKAAQDLKEAERKYYISKATIAAENKRALIAAQTSSSNSKRQSKTSRFNNAADNATSTANNNADNATGLQKQKFSDKDKAKTQRAKDRAAKIRAQIAAKKKGHHN